MSTFALNAILSKIFKGGINIKLAIFEIFVRCKSNGRHLLAVNSVFTLKII